MENLIHSFEYHVGMYRILFKICSNSILFLCPGLITKCLACDFYVCYIFIFNYSLSFTQNIFCLFCN